jgi:hypothetical protein
VGNTSLDYSVNFWTEGVFSTALGVFGVAGIGIRIEDDAFSAVISSNPLFKTTFPFIDPLCVFAKNAYTSFSQIYSTNQYTLAIKNARI